MRSVIGALLLFFFTTIVAAKDSAAEVLPKARALFEAGDFAGAATLFQSAIDAGGSPGETRQALFYFARANEEQAALQPARADHYLAVAAEAYEQLIALSPALGAALNNCAQVYGKLNKNEWAERLFRRAIEVDDPLRPFFMTNYAAFLARNDRPKEAMALYEKALALNPDNTDAEEGLLRLQTGAQVAEHLWKLVERGAWDRARKLALDHLERGLDASDSRNLLGVVAVTLAEQRVRPDDFDASPVAARLGPLTRQESIRQGIRELRRLYDGAALDDESYSWWKKTQFYSPPAYDSSVAFARLARELGSQRRTDAPEIAERYLQLAVDVSNGSDPEALVAIADLYYSENRIEDLARFATDYSNAMFEGKGRAYRDGDLPKIYRFHVALGTMYARLGWTGSSRDPKSAIFQLEHARDTVERINTRTAAGQAKVTLDPRTVDLLATSYQKAEPQGKKDLQLRLDAAAAYVRSGHTASAARVLAPVDKDPRVEQGDQKIRYQQLRTNMSLPIKDQAWIEDPGKPVLTTPASDTTANRPPNEPAVDRIVIEPNMANQATPMLAPPRVTVQLMLPRKQTTLNANQIEMLALLLGDYFSAPKSQRADLMQKLQGFGVTSLSPANDGKGIVVVQTSRGEVSIPFTTTVVQQ